MSWRIEFRPEVEEDVAQAADYYELQVPGLGKEFIEEVITAWTALLQDPLRASRRALSKDIRWCWPDRFPYRIIYEVVPEENYILVVAVLHAARHDRHWQRRI